MGQNIHIKTSEKQLKIIAKVLKILLLLIQSFLKKKEVHASFDIKKDINDGKEETK